MRLRHVRSFELLLSVVYQGFENDGKYIRYVVPRIRFSFCV